MRHQFMPQLIRIGNHLEFSDHVIFLDENGEISRQGAPNNLSVDSGDVPRTENRSSTTTTPPDSEPSEDLIHELKMLDDLELGARRVGDMKIYAYYAKIAGWWTVSIYLFACAAFVFGVTFPCKLFSVP
jgi:ATP-binding cassette subfamily C (CFTR/MRP) protein 1